MKRCVIAVVLVAGIVSAALAAVSGRVVNGSGAGVADAMVCYKSLANRLIYVYSDANGYFNIPAPTEWSITDLPMYKPVPVKTIRAINSLNTMPLSFNAYSNGSAIVFSVGKEKSRVSADLFDVSGKRIMGLFDKEFDGGNKFVFNPFIKNNTLVPQQVYIVRLRDAGTTLSLRIINIGAKKAANFLESPDHVVSLKSMPELAKIAAGDSIRAGKTGYFGKTVLISSYNDAVGNVTITVDSIEKRVDSVFNTMTMDEKAGQLMQPAMMSPALVNSSFPGSYLKGEGNTENMAAALGTPRKIPLVVGNDWVHGGRHIYFPHEIGLGCTGDTLLTELAFRVNAMSCLPLQNNETFAPCLDVHRSDRSGRVYEGFAETPELTVPYARAAVRGIQGSDLTSGYTMMATLKHWAAAGGTAQGGGHGNANTVPNLGILANIHFPPFLAGVKAGAAIVMTGYQSVFGTPMAVNKQLVTDTLKTGWGFDGFVITDWATANGREVDCINAGHDMCMTVADPRAFPGIIKNAVNGGSISQARFSDAVKRILRVKMRMGLFENPWPNPGLNNYLSSKEYRDVARACVRKSLVLLKNDDNTTLPLLKTAKVHVVGTLANNIGYQCGGWSATGCTVAENTNNLPPGGEEGWQGTGTAGAITGATTIWQGILAACPTATKSDDANNISADASIIVVVVGEPTYAEDNGDVTDITLNNLAGGKFQGAPKPPDQIALVQACKAKANAS
jgi:beta-glucosidase